MNPRVVSAKATADYKLELLFSNGERGIYDCTHLLGFGIFSELKDTGYFLQAKAVEGTVAWPHQQDICPDTLYLESHKKFQI